MRYAHETPQERYARREARHQAVRVSMAVRATADVLDAYAENLTESEADEFYANAEQWRGMMQESALAAIDAYRGKA